MKFPPISSALFVKNRSKLIDHISRDALVLVCSNYQMPRNGDQYFPYRQNSDFYYLTGITQEKSLLLLSPGHTDPALREVLFILKPDLKMKTWYGPRLSPSGASERSGISTVKYLNEFEDVLAALLQGKDRLYVNRLDQPVPKLAVHSMDDDYFGWITNKFPGIEIGWLPPVMTRMRMFKEPEELERIRAACQITGEAFNRVLQVLSPGKAECEIEAEITHQFIRSGADGHAYEPIIASGENALVLHYISNRDICRDQELLLMDIGAEVSGYASDCTRTIPVNGRFTRRQREVYEANLRVLRRAMELMTEGKKLDDFHQEVGALWMEEHIRLGLYSRLEANRQDPEQPLWKKYYMHGTSHSIGLDVHDVFDRSIPFQEGMVLSCEPAIYIPEERLGIRLENDILITKSGPVDLMKHIPLEIGEIETIMSKTEKYA